MLEALDAGSLGAVVAGIGEDLAADVGTARFQVDLQALHDYYGKVYQLWHEVNTYINSLPTDPYSTACIETSEIPGVASAIQATMDGALGPTDSMMSGVGAVSANLATHLVALAQVYTSYVNIDHQNASELTQAGSPDAANINIALPDQSTMDVPVWAANIATGFI